MEYLLILFMSYGNGRGIATERVATYKECHTIGKEWTNVQRPHKYICTPVEKLTVNIKG